MTTSFIPCLHCRRETVSSGDKFCTACGAPVGTVIWKRSPDGETVTEDVLFVPEDKPFFLLTTNTSTSRDVQTELDLTGTRNLSLEGDSRRNIPPGATEKYGLLLTAQVARGTLRLLSRDGKRKNWWERCEWSTEELKLDRRIRQKRERWILGSETLLYPPGVRQQILTLWNDAPRKRDLSLGEVEGYRPLISGITSSSRPLSVLGEQSAEVALGIVTGVRSELAEPTWFLAEIPSDVALIRMKKKPVEIGTDAVIALDFGTRNTSIRIRWRNPVGNKRAGQVDVIGEDGDGRFPTVMVLHKRRDEPIFGTEAEKIVSVPDAQIRIEKLKTALRNGEEPYVAIRPEWTTAELVARYFEEMFRRIDAYLESVGVRGKFSRKTLRLRYVLTRPVLDSNGENIFGQHYEAALTQALERCDVSPDQIEFLLEPSAATAYIARVRSAELLEHQGELIAIVDAGGGTTDIALAQVNIEGGDVKLDVKRAYALHRPDQPALLEAFQQFERDADDEFGGDTLDLALAHSLLNSNALLETDLRPVPPRVTLLDKPSADLFADEAETRIRRRDFLRQCRRMKEAFLNGSKQYLNTATKNEDNAQTVPFPDREDYRGIHLDHALYADHLLAATLRPAIETLRDEMSEEGIPADERAGKVRRIYCVGGTNVDPEVAREFSRAFPNAKQEGVSMTPTERMTAVVEGAVWSGEAVFVHSPLTLTLEYTESIGDDGEKIVRTETLVHEGESVPPEPVTRPFTARLDPENYPELEARLIADAEELPEPIIVANAYFPNPTEQELSVTLQVSLSQKEGVIADLTYENAVSPRRQWRLLLCPENR